MDELIAAEGAPPAEGPLTPDEFADAVVDSLNIRWLLDGLEERPLEVILFQIGMEDGRLTERLLLRDPWVGEIQAQVVHPLGADSGPLPAVLAVHGHGTAGDDYVDGYHGLAYVDAGARLFAIDHRMTFADYGETFISIELMLEGLTLQGVHQYETLLLHKYMRWRGDVDIDRIALIGHSAGANKGNSMIRITDAFAAYVSDTATAIGEFLPPDGELPPMHEANVPRLAPYQGLINDFSTASTPVLVQPYGWPDGPDEVVAFLEEHLDLSGAPSSAP